MTSETSILSETRTGYRVITLNRPDKLNAFNEAMHQALRKAIEDAEADEGCRALLITGAGRGFCTGQDLSDRLAKPGGPSSSAALWRLTTIRWYASCAPFPFLSSPLSTASPPAPDAT